MQPVNLTATMTPTAARQRMPTVFIPHGGGPCFFMEWSPRNAWDRLAAFLRGFHDSLPAKPQALVLVSAHWQEDHAGVTSAANPELIYDYVGFPEHTYALRYPAPGEPQLALHIASLLAQSGMSARAHPTRGLDHGTFIPLLLMYPLADVPVVQLSLHQSLDPTYHLALGQALASLRDQGVLIVGSGMSFHNMPGYGDPRFGPISDTFDEWLTQTLSADAALRTQRLIQWQQAPGAHLCHPPRAEEHLLPLMVVAGAAMGDNGRKVFSDRVMETTLSAFQFG